MKLPREQVCGGSPGLLPPLSCLSLLEKLGTQIRKSQVSKGVPGWDLGDMVWLHSGTGPVSLLRLGNNSWHHQP